MGLAPLRCLVATHLFRIFNEVSPVGIVVTNRAHEFPDYAYGGIMGRRQEAAISTQCFMQRRLRQLGISSVMKFHNIKNAFPSVSQDAGYDADSRRHDRQPIPISTLDFFRQHMKDSCTTEESHGYVVARSNRGGTPQGGARTTYIFNQAYRRATDQYIREVDMMMPDVLLPSPVLGEDHGVQVHYTCFFEDLATRVIEDNELLEKSSKEVGKCLE